MQDLYICLDVGGTEIKGAVVQDDGVVPYGIKHFPSNSDFNKEDILSHFTDIVAALAWQVPNCKITGLRLAFPGPFDYLNGVCYIKGLLKYDALYGVNLREAFFESLNSQYSAILRHNFDIRFINDASAFALGEANFGFARHTDRSLCICIGTGCGSAFTTGKTLADSSVSNVPPNGYIYNQPFESGCVDDYISKRGLYRLSSDFLAQPLEGYELAQLAYKGNENAKKCWEAFGVLLQNALAPSLLKFCPNCLVLGGQIAKSADLFTGSIQSYCRGHDISFFISENTSLRTLQGLLLI